MIVTRDDSDESKLEEVNMCLVLTNLENEEVTIYDLYPLCEKNRK